MELTYADVARSFVVRLIAGYDRDGGASEAKLRQLIESLAYDPATATDEAVRERYQASVAWRWSSCSDTLEGAVPSSPRGLYPSRPEGRDGYRRCARSETASRTRHGVIRGAHARRDAHREG